MTRAQIIRSLFEAEKPKNLVDPKDPRYWTTQHRGEFDDPGVRSGTSDPYQAQAVPQDINRPSWLSQERKGPVLGRPDTYMRRDIEPERHGSHAPMYVPQRGQQTHFPQSDEPVKTSAPFPVSQQPSVRTTEHNIHRHHANRIALMMKSPLTREMAHADLHNHVKGMGVDQRQDFRSHLRRSLSQIGFQGKAVNDVFKRHGL